MDRPGGLRQGDPSFIKESLIFVREFSGQSFRGRPFSAALVGMMRVASATVILALLASTSRAQQLVDDPVVLQNFASITPIATGVGLPTQMTFGPDGRLYVSTFTSGVKRYDVGPTGTLVNGTTVWSRPSD